MGTLSDRFGWGEAGFSEAKHARQKMLEEGSNKTKKLTTEEIQSTLPTKGDTLLLRTSALIARSQIGSALHQQS
eukprot:1499522-Amphidinium_carterae.1